jgi:hypothetical protein
VIKRSRDRKPTGDKPAPEAPDQGSQRRDPPVHLGSRDGAPLEQRLDILKGHMARVKSRNAFALLPCFRLWEGIWRNLNMLDQHYVGARKKLPDGWAPVLAELRGILEDSSFDGLIPPAERDRIRAVLSRIEIACKKGLT